MKSKNVAIKANKVEISTKQTTIDNGGYYPPVKPRVGLVDINKINKDTPSKEDIEKELGVLSTYIESNAKYSKNYCVFTTALSNIDQLFEKVKTGGYDVLKLDDKTILVRW